MEIRILRNRNARTAGAQFTCDRGPGFVFRGLKFGELLWDVRV